ncbi:hypothetical protein, partial [Streptococcus pyogenes]|uniref:hypothetical protein n=1 Tax=Streptococcus pyogenes TaxID=1314 RepID=UPI001CA30CB6
HRQNHKFRGGRRGKKRKESHLSLVHGERLALGKKPIMFRPRILIKRKGGGGGEKEEEKKGKRRGKKRKGKGEKKRRGEGREGREERICVR